MTKRFIFGLMLLSTLSCSSGQGGGAKPADIEYVKEQARIAAEAVLRLPSNTMERENAILSIRVKEQELRQRGFDVCADSFAIEAARVLGF